MLIGSTFAYYEYVGSDRHVADVTQQVDTKAGVDLAAALKRLDPCSPSEQQIADVENAIGARQLVGTDSAAATKAAYANLARPAQSLRRAFDRGEVTKTSQQVIDGVASAAGLDIKETGWQNDRECEGQWSIDVDFRIPQALFDTEVLGHVRIPVTVAGDGTVSCSGPMQLTAQDVQLPPCVLR